MPNDTSTAESAAILNAMPSAPTTPMSAQSNRSSEPLSKRFLSAQATSPARSRPRRPKGGVAAFGPSTQASTLSR